MNTKILYVCTYWGVRSQIAKLLTNALERPGLTADSAGFETGIIGELPRSVMLKRGLQLPSSAPPTVFNFARQDGDYDYVVTLCNQETQEKYQILYDVVDTLFGQRAQVINWNVADFMAIGDLPAPVRLEAANKIVDDIESCILNLLSSTYHPPATNV